MNKKIIINNKKAYFNYEILEKYEAGIVLKGSEIKSIRNGHVSLAESFCTFKNGELWIMKMYIKPYEYGGPHYNHDPWRPKKLLLHKRELLRLYGKVKEKGLTLVPLSLYLKGPYAKLEIALVKGKKLYDKRQDIAKRDTEREMRREMKYRF